MLDRARFLAGAGALGASAAVPMGARAAGPGDPDRCVSLPPSEALSRLAAGNARFAGGHPIRPPHQGPYAGKQTPFAALVVCADSRVGPELVFDQGLGSLFVCRVAGNTADPVVTGSIEYAVEHLCVPLVAVVGHSGCGACEATLASLDARTMPDASIASVVREILPVARALPAGLPPAQRLAELIARNARDTATTLAMSPVLHHASTAGRLRVVWGVHDLASGRVPLH
jgi:carbonic anhydrase